MNNTSPPNSPPEMMRANLIITGSLIVGVIMVLTIIHFVAIPAEMKHTAISTFLIIIFALAVLGAFVGNMLFQKKIKAIQTTSLMDKLTQYRTALILKYALLEAPALAAVILYLVEGNIYLPIITLLLLGLMVYHLPTKSKVTSDLSLTMQEQQQLG